MTLPEIPMCPGDTVFDRCNGRCGQECPDYNPICLAICSPGCICPKPLFLTDGFKCVEQKDCPK